METLVFERRGAVQRFRLYVPKGTYLSSHRYLNEAGEFGRRNVVTDRDINVLVQVDVSGLFDGARCAILNKTRKAKRGPVTLSVEGDLGFIVQEEGSK